MCLCVSSGEGAFGFNTQLFAKVVKARQKRRQKKKQNPQKSGSLFITIVLRRPSATDRPSKSKKIYRLLTTCYYRRHIVGEKGHLNELEWQELNKQNCWQWAKYAKLYSGLLQTQKRGPFHGILISALAISLTGTGRQQRLLPRI